MLTTLAAGFVALVLAGVGVTTLLAVLKWLINRSKRNQCDSYRQVFERYVKENEEERTLQRAKPRIMMLFQQANVADVGVSMLTPEKGLGALGPRAASHRPGPLSAFGLFPTRRPDLAPLMLAKFNEAAGTYEQRMQDACNPLYWLESIAYLPRHIATYLGVSSDNMITKLLLVVYWFAGFAGSVIASIIGSDVFLEWLVEKFSNS